MTCIVALKDRKGSVWMGADRCSQAQDRNFTHAGPKIALLGDMLIGAAGMIAISHDFLSLSSGIPLREDPRQDAFEYIRNTLMPWAWARGEFRRSNYMRDGSNYMDVSLLIGMDGRIFSMDSGGGVMETVDPYFAVGAGRDWAMGSLMTSSEIWEERNTGRMKPKLDEIAIQLSLACAAKFSSSVEPPFDILCLKGTR